MLRPTVFNVYDEDSFTNLTFRVPSSEEVVELQEEFAVLDFVGTPPPFFDWLAQRMLLRVNDRKPREGLDMLEVSPVAAAEIRRKMRQAVTDVAGRCVCCGDTTPASSVMVCDVCLIAGWIPATAIRDFRTEIQISRLVGTPRWAIRDKEIAFIDKEGHTRVTPAFPS